MVIIFKFCNVVFLFNKMITKLLVHLIFRLLVKLYNQVLYYKTLPYNLLIILVHKILLINSIVIVIFQNIWFVYMMITHKNTRFMLKVKSLMKVLKIQSNSLLLALHKIYQVYMKQRLYTLKKTWIMYFQIDGKIIHVFHKQLIFQFQLKNKQKIILQNLLYQMVFIHMLD